MIKTKYVIFTLFALCLLACTPKDEKELIGGGTHYRLSGRLVGAMHKSLKV